jgi:hypothetical protein
MVGKLCNQKKPIFGRIFFRRVIDFGREGGRGEFLSEL